MMFGFLPGKECDPQSLGHLESGTAGLHRLHRSSISGSGHSDQGAGLYGYYIDIWVSVYDISRYIGPTPITKGFPHKVLQ